ncbi:P2Y purinoceptor 11 isoform X2 [Electrophorus electricus]|uniref:G-protein coupled receptors family 1 profile domain-containing protein n=1 Tax=Electrophorus electricus TaxID=8005 RepID=A0A4W4H1H4_ELEEL|nr:P2Y purinoceptor 11 isoform X2 [Electrophorus electricus]
MNLHMTNKSCDETFQKQLLPPIYGIEMCVALAGNIFALWLLVTKERRNWHTGVVFSCNLAISDILYSLTLPLLIDYYSNEKRWKFGSPACKIERYLFTCNLYVSMFFIMCISINRYLAIVHPFFTRKSVRPRHAKIASVLVWVTVAVISAPVLWFAGVRETGVTRKGLKCFTYTNAKPKQKLIFSLFIATIGCLVPFLVTIASYIGVIRVVLKNRNITMLEKRKVALIVALVCILYLISFVPYHILHICNFHMKRSCFVYKAYQVSRGLASLNMCLHPILYMAVFDSIRTACCRRNSNESFNMQTQQSSP